jgi:hypothetical protein
MKLIPADGIRTVLTNGYKIFLGLTHLGFFRKMKDERYLRLLYRGVLARPLHLDPPVLYSEKLQWLKLHDKNPMYPTLCDKFAVRGFVRERVGEECLVDLYGVWDDPDEIDFTALPEQFVLKCTHDSGSAIICMDKSTFDVANAKASLRKRLEKDYSIPGREWPYHDVPRRVMAERYLTDANGTQAMDYKFFCFDGKACLILVCTNQSDHHSGNYTYKMDFSLFPIYSSVTPQADDPHLEKPAHFERMVEIAQALSAGFVHMRVDLYDTPDGVKFGEMTLHSSSGLSQTMTLDGDRFLGGLLRLEIVR